MLTKTSRDITSNLYPTHQIIQFSTLGRAYRDQLVSRYSVTPRSAQIASFVSRAQLAAGRSFAGLLVVLLTLFYPVGAYAQDTVAPSTSEVPTSVSNTAPSVQPSTTTPVSQQTTTPSPTVTPPSPTPPTTTDTASSTNPPKSSKKQTGPQKASPKPATPKTGPQKPNGADANKYIYNEKTGRWENGQYAWDPATGQSKPINAPDYSYNPETKAWDTTEWRYDPTAGKYVPNNITTSPQPVGSEIPLDGDSTQFFSLYNNATISNSVNSHAQSGDSWVTGNTLAGNALTGDALALVNILNMINSSAGFQNGGEIATFSSDIYGNVYGDLYVDPGALTALQPAAGVGGTDGNTDIQVNANLSNSVANEVNLNAQSGNANVSRNTAGGNATSGSANAVANLINMLNSAISSGGSFLGVLNIYGSLNGDILLPPGLLNALLASNATNSTNSTSVNANLSDTQSITNNIKTNATSGSATVAHNTQAGNATTGNGQTNVTILNLTGRNVVAANSLLVFVNVLGQWVGVIMDAPAGTTSAALGSGVTANSSSNLDATYNVNTSNAIVNNVDVNAKSGDANVTGNTKAGNASTGDATASVNVANISNSNFSLSGWFGILFINVFGSWNGSFGVDTAAGSRPNTPHQTNKSSSTATSSMAPKVFQFVPTGNSSGTTLAAVDMNNPASVEAVSKAVKAAQQKIATTTTSGHESSGAQPQSTASSAQRMNSPDYTLPILSFAFGGVLLGGEQIVSRRQRRKQLAA